MYRGETKLNDAPITKFLDSWAPTDASYTVRAVVNGTEQAPSEPSLRRTGGNYLDAPISLPGNSYTAGDASVGDVDAPQPNSYVRQNPTGGRVGDIEPTARPQPGLAARSTHPFLPRSHRVDATTYLPEAEHGRSGERRWRDPARYRHGECRPRLTSGHRADHAVRRR
ncbi:hypothetical protein UK23_45650, partial [Lentzea aerocolonigenes]